ncbi:MAG: transketolase family protein [Ruminococcus sp.]|nr:transketolase family protein [Ruminococcus sp.]
MAEIVKKATRESFGEALCELAAENKDIVVLDADLAAATKTGIFQKAYPDRFFDCGIAEGNMIGVAAGMAAAGKIPVAASFAMFATGRAFEQIRNSVAYPELNVKIAGSHAGISTGEDGATHQCIEDIGIMRAIPNMMVLNPADHWEMKEATKAAIAYDGPVYIRLGRLAIDSFNDPETYTFELGKGITLHEGNDVAVIATGLVVNEALKAVKELEAEGINARLINIHTIKPIDRDIIVKAAQETGRIITVEEHNVVGGLADAVCEVVTEECPVKVTKIGVQDRFGFSGPAWELLDNFELTQPHIAKVIRKVVAENK